MPVVDFVGTAADAIVKRKGQDEQPWCCHHDGMIVVSGLMAWHGRR
jgi:hypothetical protein